MSSSNTSELGQPGKIPGSLTTDNSRIGIRNEIELEKPRNGDYSHQTR